MFHPLRRLRQAIIKRFAALLTKPLNNYAVRFPNDLDALKSQIRKGDVLLVEGSQRISEVVKYLTQSSWSHSAIYIGDELIRGNHPLAEQARTTFGDDAQFLLVEALVEEGVVLSLSVEVRRVQYPSVPPAQPPASGLPGYFGRCDQSARLYL